MSRPTRKQVLTLAAAASTPQQIDETERMVGQWLEEHPEDRGYLYTVTRALAMRRYGTEVLGPPGPPEQAPEYGAE